MDEKKKVYVETSVISNLTARPSRSVIDMGHQVATYEWWASCQGVCDLFSSSVADREASKGDAAAAALRMDATSEIMEELWKVKEEIASQFKTFREFAEDMLRYQAEHHPELATA